MIALDDDCCFSPLDRRDTPRRYDKMMKMHRYNFRPFAYSQRSIECMSWCKSRTSNCPNSNVRVGLTAGLEY